MLNYTNSGAFYLQSVDFRYSIRGQMFSINNNSLSVDDKNYDSNDVFGMQFSYDHADAAIGNTPYYEVTLGLLDLSDKFDQQISDTRFGFMLRRKIIDVKHSQNDVSSLVYSIKVFKDLVKSNTHYDLKKHGYSQKSIGIYSLYYGQKIQIRSLW